ncbi:uncharacterized protein N7496_008280 [Penicillium cataractarum]|uniref:Uncharacterized protein n=1 Tax=Penicillium cataractarum TaxID=2100454 RepID=A0A9W9RZE4_9EURO|nr:uncharacterized protein N7496_008280 [Penicillium cataractarum]KAJ5368520.1 hypothetical protein N7496_008280 [Penicillium cataractarum]
MHRFRKNKKVKETLDELENGPSTSTSPFSLKPSKKKDAAEAQFQLDLSGALPSSDDFRTSLLMPKLSARFSMLREQDDPDTMIGKASDDSVLFPKRASRLNLFGHNPSMLTDIDEVSSNDGSRPSIALGRADSYASGMEAGYGTDDDRLQSGSIMSRARRAEGNNLFGGRQKVYRIPVRSPSGTEPSSTEPTRGMGKFVYEHDLNMSAFQKMRHKEKEEQRLAEEAAQAEAAQEAAMQESEDATSTFSTKRTTYSSTASGPTTNARTSTAATSIDESLPSVSQTSTASAPAPECPVDARPPSAMSTPRNGSVRSRRLYGQGLTQTAQNQQSSTLSRLESLSRQRAGTPDLIPLNRNFSRSATNLRDRLQKLNVTEPATTARSTSPPSSATSPKQPTLPEAAPKDRISPTVASFGVAPPLSPPTSENEDGNNLLAAALNPEDHGKATAMGLFNRPATGFDEQQFMRRQLQMHQGRNTPPPRRPSSPRRAPPQEPAGRSRGLSKSSYRSRAESASSHYSSDAHNGIDHSQAPSVEASPGRPGMTTFYANSTASDSGDENDDRRSYEVSSVTTMATDFGHPLQHTSTASKPPTPTGEHLETLPEVRYSDLGDLKPIEEDESMENDALTQLGDGNTPQRPDSPTFGLNGFIQSHLRQVSNQSSIYPPPSPGLPPQDSNANNLATDEPISEVTTPALTPDETPSTLDMQIEPSSPKPPSHQSSDVTANRSSGDSSDASALPGHGVAAPHSTNWRDELAYHHRRDGSTETQKEREEFAMELAERRRKVQEKLRSVAESESRSSSPTPGRQTPDFGGIKAGNAFSLLKHKPGKQGPPQQDAKSKMYGYNSGSTPALVSEDSWREEERPSFNLGRHSNSSSPYVGSERSIRSRMPTIGRNSNEDSRESSRSRGPSPHNAFRSRSGSDASGRSKSRTRYRERDDLQTVDEGAVIAHDNFVVPDNFEPPSVSSSARPSMEVEPLMYDRSSSAASGRYRSASRSGTGPPNFQYERPFAYQQSHPPSIIGATPRAPPAAPAYSANATPPLNEDQSPTATISSAGSSAHALPQRAPGSNLLQKRSVNKKLISEPTLVSSTSNVPLVGLPTGNSMASISSQQGATPPPLPPMNPRRRRGTQTILSAFKSDKHESRVSSPAPSISDEQSYFPDDEKRPRSRNRLRKTSSEGGNLHGRARGDSMVSPAPAVPQYPPPAIPVDGGMF